MVGGSQVTVGIKGEVVQCARGQVVLSVESGTKLAAFEEHFTNGNNNNGSYYAWVQGELSRTMFSETTSALISRMTIKEGV